MATAVAKSVESTTLGTNTQVNSLEEFADFVIQRMESICADCPNFMLPYVLDGVVLHMLTGKSYGEIEIVLERAQKYSPQNLVGFGLGLRALEGCVSEGVCKFRERLLSMSSDEIIKEIREKV